MTLCSLKLNITIALGRGVCYNNKDRIDIGDAAKIAYYLVGKISEL